MNKMIKCFQCESPATSIMWGCCDNYREPACDMHRNMLMSEDTEDDRGSCEPMDWEPIEDYMVSTNGYGF